MMREVLVLCEGQTEREFVRRHVAPAVAGQGVALSGTLVGKTHRKRGGIRGWAVYERELIRLASERADRHLALLVDYYAMPADWPGRAEAAGRPLAERGAYVEQRLAEQADPVFRDRFVPCVQYHEFESLLFVDGWTTAWELDAVGRPRSSAAVEKKINEAVAAAGGQAEWVNDGPDSAPSKRIAQMIVGYDKVAWGNQVVDAVTLPRLRKGCPWLDRWMAALQALEPDFT